MLSLGPFRNLWVSMRMHRMQSESEVPSGPKDATRLGKRTSTVKADEEVPPEEDIEVCLTVVQAGQGLCLRPERAGRRMSMEPPPQRSLGPCPSLSPLSPSHLFFLASPLHYVPSFAFSAPPRVLVLTQPLTCWAPWGRPLPSLGPAFSFWK